jgi:hypothetical protein
MSEDDRTKNGSDEHGHETAAQAVRAAAAAAAVGAALGAVRALTSRGADEDEQETGDTQPDEPDDDDEGAEEDETPPTAEIADDDQDEEPEPAPQQSRKRREDRRPTVREGASRSTVSSVVARAREQLRDLQGREAESVTAIERIDGGWRVTCEVVEVERIPNSTDVLATYVVELDDDCELLQFERVRRYYRAQADLGDER